MRVYEHMFLHVVYVFLLTVFGVLEFRCWPQSAIRLHRSTAFDLFQRADTVPNHSKESEDIATTTAMGSSHFGSDTQLGLMSALVLMA